jgi:hypothetical protein
VSQEAGKSDSSSNQNLNHNANNSATTPTRQSQAHAQVNHVAMEDAQAAPDVNIGMILVNDNYAIVLFDLEHLIHL